MYQSTVKVLKNCSLEFSKLSFKVASVYMLPQSSDICTKSSDMLKSLGHHEGEGGQGQSQSYL